MKFNHTLNKQSPMPLYHQLKDVIIKEISDGNWKPEDMIPTEFEIMDHFNVSRTTVRQALTDLVKDNLLYRKKGVGTFVAKPKIDLKYIGDDVSINSQIQNAGMTPHIKIIEFTVIDNPAIELVRALNLSIGDKVIHLLRVRYADDEPIAVVNSYLPYTLCSFIFNADFEKNSLYQVLATKTETRVISVDRIVEAQLANRQDRELMGVEKGFPVQNFASKAYNLDGVVVEYSISRYRSDRNKLFIKIDVK